jgi:hypothetical protein
VLAYEGLVDSKYLLFRTDNERDDIRNITVDKSAYCPLTVVQNASGHKACTVKPDIAVHEDRQLSVLERKLKKDIATYSNLGSGSNNFTAARSFASDEAHAAAASVNMLSSMLPRKTSI